MRVVSVGEIDYIPSSTPLSYVPSFLSKPSESIRYVTQHIIMYFAILQLELFGHANASMWPIGIYTQQRLSDVATLCPSNCLLIYPASLSAWIIHWIMVMFLFSIKLHAMSRFQIFAQSKY